MTKVTFTDATDYKLISAHFSITEYPILNMLKMLQIYVLTTKFIKTKGNDQESIQFHVLSKTPNGKGMNSTSGKQSWQVCPSKWHPDGYWVPFWEKLVTYLNCLLCPELRRRGILVSGCPSVHTCVRAYVRSSHILMHILWTVHARDLRFHI